MSGSILRVVRRVALPTALAVAVEVAAVALPVTSAQAAPKPAAPAEPLVRPDLVSAAVAARATGQRVEVESLRTETSTTWSNPDGTMTTDAHAGQIRYREGGRWRDVDLTLEPASDGTVVTHGHAHGLRAGHGVAGGAALATVSGGAGREVTLAWPGSLPAPVVDGTRVTYPEVTPGVDAVVESLRSGYEQMFVVKERPAGPLSWDLPLLTKGLTARAEKDGSVSFVDAKGAVASRFAPAVAWDAAVEPLSGEHLNRSPVAMTVTQQGKGRATLRLTPDAEWLADPARQYPVTVDPTYAALTVYGSFDAFVQNTYSSDQSAATELKLGTYDGGGNVARSFINFPTSSIKGKKIMSASLSLYAIHSYSCTARNWQVWHTGNASTATRWTAQPTWGSHQATTSVTKGYSTSCPDARVTVDVKTQVTSWSTGSGGTGTLGLKAESETDSYGWKRFSSSETANDPYLSITYDRAPGTAAQPSVSPTQVYNTWNYTSDTTPAFTSKSTDADGNTVKMKFEVHSSTTTSSTTLKATCTTSAYVASGANATCSPTTALADNATYYVRAQAYDGYLWGAAWSNWRTIKVAAAAPAAPTISCPSPYTNGSWSDTPPAANVSCTVNVPGSGLTAPVKALVSIDGGAETAYAVTPGSTASVTVSVSKASGGHSIKARAQSASGVNSAYAPVYTFGYGAAGLSSPVAGAKSTDRFAISAFAPPATSSTVTAKAYWRLAGTADAADFNASRGTATGWNDTGLALTPVSTATGGVGVSAIWQSKLATTGIPSDRVPVLLDIQVCFTYTSTGVVYCTWTGDAESNVSVLRVPHAFGDGFPTDDAGPGQVALWTGELNVAASDVTVPGYSGTLGISRSHSTFAGPDDVVTGIYGPGWTAHLDGAEAGLAGVQVVDNTLVDGTIVLADGDGSVLVFRQPGGTKTHDKAGTYTPVGDTVLDRSSLSLAGSGTAMTLTFTEEDGTVTVWRPVAFAAGATTAWKPESVNEPGQLGATTYSHDSAGRVTRILAAPPPGVTCAATGALNPGCRALRLVYGSTTTATAAAPGDVAGQVKEIWLDIYNPARADSTAGMDSVKVAAYQYDAAKRLVSVTDPRSGLTARYSYDGVSTRLASVSPAGLAAHRFTYDTANGDRLKQVTRDAATAGGASTVQASFVYGIDPATFTTGLPDLRADDDPATTIGVERWGQAQRPTYGAAVFGADHPVPTTSPAAIGADEWSYAELSYTDSQGYEVNTAGFGAGVWQVTATGYDARGNVVHTLDARATARVAELTALLAPGESLDPDQYATIIRYNPEIKSATGVVLTPAGTYAVDEWGPARDVTLADGSVTWARPHTRTEFDAGAPNGGLNPASGLPYGLPTRVTLGVAAAGSATTDPAAVVPSDIETVSAVVTGYDPIDGSTPTGATSGWTLGAATSSTTVMVASADDITTSTRYDAAGRVVETRAPGSTGNDAGTTKTLFYVSGTGSGDTACDNRPEWAGLPCVTGPAAAPTSGPALPSTRFTGYSYLLAPTAVVQTSGSVTRTTTTSYLADGRNDAAVVSVTGLVSSTPMPRTKSVYDAATGLPTEAQTLDAAGAVIARVITGYDLWGRPTTYTNSQGETTTTSFDDAGRVSTVVDAKGVTTYGYGTDLDGAVERRGLPTSVTVSGAGTFRAAYDAAGGIVKQELPGGVVQTTTYDDAGESSGMAYSGPVTTTDPETGVASTSLGPWLGWSHENDVTGRVRREWTPIGSAFTDGPDDGTSPGDVGDAVSYDRQYRYDRAARLVTVEDRTAGATGEAAPDDVTLSATPCVTRHYTFDRRGNRTALTETPAGADGACSTATTPSRSRTWSYDDADRTVVSAGYDYDELGRALTLPAGDSALGGATTLRYYDSDLVRSIAHGTDVVTYSLDAVGRRLDAVTTPASGGAATRTVTRHYTDTTDNPGWTEEVVAGQQAASITRFVESLAGDLAATVTDGVARLLLTNPHDDTVTTVTLPGDGSPAAGIDAWSDYDEYGNRTSGGAVSALGYGWLGGRQRSADSGTSGLLLMGARLYNPLTGRFTSVDPVTGGNENAYNYPNDPVNQVDLDGLWGMPKIRIRLPKISMPKIEYGKWIDRVNTGLSVAAMFGCGPCAAASAGISVVRGAYKVFVDKDKSGWADIAGAGLFGAAKGLKYLGKASRVKNMAKHPKGIRGKAKFHKRQRSKIAARHRSYERRVVRRADRIDRAYGGAQLAYGGFRAARDRDW